MKSYAPAGARLDGALTGSFALLHCRLISGRASGAALNTIVDAVGLMLKLIFLQQRH